MIITLSIPENSKCMVKVGDKLTFDKILFEKNVSNIVEVMVADELGVPPEKIFRYLQKFLGESIQKGDVIALKKSFLSPSRVLAKTAGVIREIDHKEGKLFIEVTLAKTNQINSPVVGTVKKITDLGIEIEVGKVEENKAKNIFSKNDFGGEVVYVAADGHDLTSEIENKILVADSLTSLTITKAEALGALGFILTNKPADKTSLPIAQLTDSSYLENIRKNNLPYCFVDIKKSKMYFYSSE